jgi:shikimate kinase/nucleoside-diphosphate-sugar epimerase
MILIAGCGYLGTRIADLLHHAGEPVIGLTHSSESADRLSQSVPYPIKACDISDPDAVNALANEPSLSNVTAVIHCASSGRGGAEAYRRVYLGGMKNLVAAFPRAVPVFTSSTSVYPQVDGSVVDEGSPTDPDRETGQILRETEDFALSQKGLVARLAGIYGPDRSFVLKNLLERKAGIEGGDGNGRILNQIHKDDAAQALIHLIKSGSVGLFNVVDDTPITQRACLEALAAMFGLPVPPEVPPNPERKRGWTNKAVSNAKLHSTGWTAIYPSYLDAVQSDPDLVSSILAQIEAESPRSLIRRPNVVLIGLMGCGKSTVGRMVAAQLGFQFADTDQLIVEAAGQTIPQIFESEGEEGFRRRESAVLRSLMSRDGWVIATGGGIVTQPRNHPLLRHLGFIAWLDASVDTLHRRTAGSRDRPLLREGDPKAKLQSLMDVRRPIYKALTDLRIATDDLTQDEAAYGLAESVRMRFSGL